MIKYAYNSLLLAGALVFLGACGKGGSADAQTEGGPETRIAVQVDAQGYHPSQSSAPAGKPVRLVFTRTADEGCGQQLVFPKLGIQKDLPLNQQVAVDITMPASGSVEFTCNMNMYKGSVIAQ